jgi:hydroxymethylpyrimidine/phosphomethylpyrimidine kinase
MKVALTIAGSDPSGGAGIQADLKTFTVLGVYGMSAITALTVQNTLGVTDVVEMTPTFVAGQIDAVAGDIHVDACKTGMVSSVELIEAVADGIRRNALRPYVCDPVMYSKAGSPLLKKEAVGALRKHLVPLATVITPNRREAAELAGVAADVLTTVAAAKEVARRIAGDGAKAVVVKGFEVAGAEGGQVVDLFYDGREFLEFAGPAHPAGKTHGSGCAFSAAITAGLADRKPLVEAIDLAKQLVTTAIQFGEGQGRGVTPVNVLAFKLKAGKK